MAYTHSHLHDPQTGRTYYTPLPERAEAYSRRGWIVTAETVEA